MKQTLYIDDVMPSLNDFIGALKQNRHIGQKMKRQWTDYVRIAAQVQLLKPYQNGVELKFRWYEKNLKRDPDNIVFAKKFILDGLQEAGVIPQDNQKYIKKFTDEWVVDNKNTGVLVTIEEHKDDGLNNSLVGLQPSDTSSNS